MASITAPCLRLYIVYSDVNIPGNNVVLVTIAHPDGFRPVQRLQVATSKYVYIYTYTCIYLGTSGALICTPRSRALVTRTCTKRAPNLWKQPFIHTHTHTYICIYI